MCGNGIRCVAKYVYDYGLTDKTELAIESAGKTKYISLYIKDGKVDQVKVNMGAPELAKEKIPVKPMPDADKTAPEQEIEGSVIAHPIIIGDVEYRMTCVSMGNPHAVVFMDEVRKIASGGVDSAAIPTEVRPAVKTSVRTETQEAARPAIKTGVRTETQETVWTALSDLEIEKIGPKFEHHPCFPNRTNTEFVEVIDRHTVAMRVWERGTGETLACGTGCCAVVVACVLNGRTEEDVTVRLLGGELQIRWDRTENCVYMTGPARVVFEGEIEI